jgi:hypothetical protein
VPARRERAGLRLAVADDAGNDQVRVVEGRSIGVGNGVAELTSLVDRPGRLRRDMARNAAGKRELSEQALHPLLVGGDVRIYLAVSALEISVCDQTGSAMSGTRDVDHVEVVLFDEPIQVNVDEVQTRRRSPMAEEAWFDVVLREGLLEERIVIKIDLADRQIVRCPPIRIHQFPLIVSQRVCHRCLL